jgi:phage tail sheath protein FI
VKTSRATGRASLHDWQDALNALATWKDIDLVAAPDSTEQGRFAIEVQSLLIKHVETPGAYRFAVLDVPQGKTPAEAAAWRKQFDSKSAAFYYPWVMVPKPSAGARGRRRPRSLALPPSGFICGVYARSDLERGVWKAPANEPLREVTGCERTITPLQQSMLASAGVNCLRYIEGKGHCVWGARTASADADWKYVNVRRYLIFLECSIDRGTQWAVFEPNDEKLWTAVCRTISSFLLAEWRNGGLAGQKPDEAFFVRCDRTTMTEDDLDHGRLICEIGVAPVRPAEFVIFRIGQWTAGACD